MSGKDFRTISEVVEDFGVPVEDKLIEDFDPEDMAFDADMVLAEADAAMTMLRAAVKAGKRVAVDHHAAELGAAIIKLSYYAGDL